MPRVFATQRAKNSLLSNNRGGQPPHQTESDMKTRLNKKELAAFESLANKIWALRQKYDEENGTDIALQIEGNGTVGSNLSCAAAALDTILQEYYN